MSLGSLSKVLLNLKIASSNVAENNNVCGLVGMRLRMLLISSLKPISNIRSASSKTRYSRCSNDRDSLIKWSSNRPGVATKISTPAFNAAICGLMLTPP